MRIVRRYKLDDLPDINKDGKSPIGVVRDAAKEEASHIIDPIDFYCLTVPVSEATSNGLINGSDVIATIVRDENSLVVEIVNSETSADRTFDCVANEDKPEDNINCHGRGLLIAKKLLARINGTIKFRKKEDVYITTIEVPASKKI